MTDLTIDTKGHCLLCLSDYHNETGHTTCSVAFKMLLRYLKIDLMKLGHFSSTFSPFLSGPDSVDISVILCNRCSSVTNHFLQLFQDLEILRMELDNCVGKVQEAIKEGMENGSRVSQYRQRVQNCDSNSNKMNLLDALNASIGETIRQETLEKCIRNRDSSSPRVLISDLKAKFPSPKQTGTTWSSSGVKMEILERGAESRSSSSLTNLTRDELLLGQRQGQQVSSDERSAGISKPKKDNFDIKPHLGALPDDIPIQHQDHHYRQDSLETWDHHNETAEKSFPHSPVSVADDPQEVDECSNGDIYQPSEVYKPIYCNRVTLANGNLKCLKCGEIFDIPGNFRKHYLEVHLKTSFKCVYCKKIFATFYSLSSHLATAHTLLKFSGQLPTNTTEQELKQAVKLLVRRPKKKQSKGKRSSGSESSPLTLACPLPFCDRKCGSNIRSHLFLEHLDQVVEVIVQIRTSTKCMRKVTSSTPIPGILTSDAEAKISSWKQVEGNGSAEMDKISLRVRSLSSSSSTCSTKDNLLREPVLHTFSVDEPQEVVDVCDDDELYQMPAEVYEPIKCNRAKLPNGKFKCLKCEKTFDGTGNFRKHYLHVHRKTSFKCVYCRKIYPKPYSLASHVATAHTLLKFSDDLPPNTTDHELKQAVKLLIPRNIKGKITSSSKSSSLTLACPLPLCGTKCGSNMKAHMFQSHLHQVAVAIDQIKCGITSSTSPSLECSHCHLSFRWLSELQAHLISTHTFLHFSHRLPPGTTEEELESVVESILTTNIPSEQLEPVGCPICFMSCLGGVNLRIHLFEIHFDHVLSRLERDTKPLGSIHDPFDRLIECYDEDIKPFVHEVQILSEPILQLGEFPQEDGEVIMPPAGVSEMKFGEL